MLGLRANRGKFILSLTADGVEQLKRTQNISSIVRMAVVPMVAALFSCACVVPSVLRGASVRAALLAAASIFAASWVLMVCLARLMRNTENIVPSVRFNRTVFLASFAVITLYWLLYFSALLPGVYTADSTDIAKMVLGLPFEADHFRYQTLNAHHPGLYVGLCWLVLSLSGAAGLDLFASCAVLSLVHLVLLSVCCAYVLERLYGLSRSRLLVGIFVVFAICNPLVGYYSSTVWKDVLFGGVFAVFVIEYIAFVGYGRCAFQNRVRHVVFIASACVCALLRSNGLLMVVVSLVVVWVVSSSDSRRSAVKLLGIVLGCFLIVAKVVYPLMGVAPAHASEGMAIPLQQIAYTIKEDGNLSEDQKNRLSRILPLDEWAEGYISSSANGVKFNKDFNDEYFESHKLAFIADWLAIGFENPGKYLRAWCLQTQSFWNMSADTWYIANPGCDLEGVNADGNGLPSVFSVDALKAALSDYKAAFPWLFNMAWIAWLVIFSMAALLFLDRKKAALCLTPLVGYWLTFLIAAPANDFRYMFPVMLCIPLLFHLFQYVLPQERIESRGMEKDVVDGGADEMLREP